MNLQYEALINKAYDAFNIRDIDGVLSLMHHNVRWPNGWEGGYVKGHDAVWEYWTSQWKEIDPIVKPVSIKDTGKRQIEVTVHQVAKDLQGAVLFNGIIKHIYTIGAGKIKSMEIDKR